MTKDALDLASTFPELNEIVDDGLRRAVATVYERLWAKSAYERLADVPVAVLWDYPAVKHTQAMVRLALAAARIFEQVHGAKLDRDHLIAGALLMEAANLVEFRPKPGGGTETTEIGRAGPHGWLAANLALEAGAPMPVVHIVLAHSPNSGKAPNTPEAQLLHWVCQASVNSFRRDAWTRKVMHYQGS